MVVRTESVNIASLRPVTPSDVPLLREFYEGLDHPLADLSELMMAAWRDALSLRYLVHKGVLYVVAQFEGRWVLWGPPLGPSLRHQYLHFAFRLLRDLNPPGSDGQICYLWDGYSLWDELRSSPEFTVLPQACEYHYDTDTLAGLRGHLFRAKRREYRRFAASFSPSVVEYSDCFADACMGLLDRWIEQKSPRIMPSYQDKFLMESQVCRAALADRLPLCGVIVLVRNEVAAFSVGGAQGAACFNCMFEKASPDLKGSFAYVFVELAKYCQNRFRYINAGEDWGVEYLTASKLAWRPYHIQRSYTVREGAL